MPSRSSERPLSERGQELDAISRTRALTDAESLELERELILATGRRLPMGLLRTLVRHGIKRDMKKYTNRTSKD